LFLRETALPLVSQQSGLVARHVGRPHDPSSTEYLFITVWEDVESIRAFAGERWQEAAAVFERLEVAVADRVNDPDRAAVRITFGWASTDGDTELDLRTLTERADAALRDRKPAGSR
jgi:hypothetical protein